jgi:hypothetical protein
VNYSTITTILKVEHVFYLIVGTLGIVNAIIKNKEWRLHPNVRLAHCAIVSLFVSGLLLVTSDYLVHLHGKSDATLNLTSIGNLFLLPFGWTIYKIHKSKKAAS